MTDARDRARGQTSRSRTQKSQRTASRSSQRGATGTTTYYNQNTNDNALKTNNERKKDQLEKLEKQGQGNSTQANDIYYDLARSDAKANQWSKELGRNLSYDEKINLAYGIQPTPQVNKNIQIHTPEHPFPHDYIQEGKYGGYSNPQEQYAASLLDYNKKYGIAGGGVGLGSSGYMQYTNIPDVYHTTYPKGAKSGYSPTGYQYIGGPGALYENGELVDGYINRYTWPGGGDGNYSGGPGGWGDSWGAGYGGGGGGGGGGGYAPPEENFTPRGNPNEAWGQQNPLQQAMISIHGGQGFQQGFRRGGIVSLVT